MASGSRPEVRKQGQQSAAAATTVSGGNQFDSIRYRFNIQRHIVQERQTDVDSEADSNRDPAGPCEELIELFINRGANINHKDKVAKAGH